MGRRPRPEIARLLHGCELLVLPSRSEPFGIALIEAMACRKPVVAAAVGGIREIVTSGEDGLLVPPEDPGALAAAIGAVLRDRALGRRLGERARETVARRFTFETTGSAYAKLFEDVRSAGRPASSRLSASAEA
jgi:glycosyltransferase involved in cell wall biosynthesis